MVDAGAKRGRKRSETAHAEQRLTAIVPVSGFRLHGSGKKPLEKERQTERILRQRNRFDLHGFDPVFCGGFRLFFHMFSAENQNRRSAACLEFTGNAETGVEVPAGPAATDG